MVPFSGGQSCNTWKARRVREVISHDRQYSQLHGFIKPPALAREDNYKVLIQNRYKFLLVDIHTHDTFATGLSFSAHSIPSLPVSFMRGSYLFSA